MQARAKERYDAIVRAAADHYDEVGRDRFNIEGVAERAGCSVATVYRYFVDRVDLLDTAVPERDRAEAAIKELLVVREDLNAEAQQILDWYYPAKKKASVVSK